MEIPPKSFNRSPRTAEGRQVSGRIGSGHFLMERTKKSSLTLGELHLWCLSKWKEYDCRDSFSLDFFFILFFLFFFHSYTFNYEQKHNSVWSIIKRKTCSHVPSSTPSVFEMVDFVFLHILTKPKACITHSSAILTLTGTCLGPNPNPNGYLPRP